MKDWSIAILLFDIKEDISTELKTIWKTRNNRAWSLEAVAKKLKQVKKPQPSNNLEELYEKPLCV